MVAYLLVCSNCRHTLTGQRVIPAKDAAEASARLAAIEIPCRYCDRRVLTDSTAKTVVFEGENQDTSSSGTGPDIPRT